MNFIFQFMIKIKGLQLRLGRHAKQTWAWVLRALRAYIVLLVTQKAYPTRSSASAVVLLAATSLFQCMQRKIDKNPEEALADDDVGIASQAVGTKNTSAVSEKKS